MAVMITTVMVPIAVAHIVGTMIIARVYRRVIVNRRRCDDDWRGPHHGRCGHTEWRRRDYDGRDGDPDVDTERYAGTRGIGGGGSEGDCYCCYCKYLFHTYQFDGLFTTFFTALNSLQLPNYQALARRRARNE